MQAATELGDTIRRHPLVTGGFTCLYDPRKVKLRTLTESVYFAHEHVIVSYNGDLRGFVEDTYGRERRVRCAVAMFSAVGAIVEGTALIATMPDIVAHQLVARNSRLALARFPLPQVDNGMDLLWPAAFDADDGHRFLRDEIVAISRALQPRVAH